VRRRGHEYRDPSRWAALRRATLARHSLQSLECRIGREDALEDQEEDYLTEAPLADFHSGVERHVVAESEADGQLLSLEFV
jgi:hypothetical protein